MTRLDWTAAAKRDLDKIVDYLSQEDVRRAERVVVRILDAVERLARHSTGRPGRVAGTLEKSILSTPYVIAYQIRKSDDDAVETLVVLRIVHTARNWPRGGWPDDSTAG